MFASIRVDVASRVTMTKFNAGSGVSANRATNGYQSAQFSAASPAGLGIDGLKS